MSLRDRLIPFAGVATFFAVWEIYVRVFDVRPIVLPRPSAVFGELFGNVSFYAEHALVSLGEAIGGLVIAFFLATVVATIMALSSTLERAGWPLLIMIQATPVVVLAPILASWLGLSYWPKIVVAALFAFVPLTSATFTGLRSVDPATLEVVRSVDASRWEILWHLRVPYALPAVFSVAKIAFTLTLLGAVIAELTGISTAGLGNVFRVAWSGSKNVNQAWAAVFCTALLGVLATAAVTALEKRTLRWHSSQTNP